MSTYEGDGNAVQDGFPALMNQLGGTGQHNGDCLLIFYSPSERGLNVGFDRERAHGNIPTDSLEAFEVGHMCGQLVDLDIIGSILRVGPSLDSMLGRVQNVLSIGANKIGAKRNIECVMYRRIRGLGRVHGGGCGSSFGMAIERRHGHIGVRPTHAKVGTHPLGPVTHIR